MRFAMCVTSLAVVASSASAQCSPSIDRMLREQKPDEARKEVQAIVSRTPDDHAAHNCLGQISLWVDRYKEAVGHFERAIKLNDRVSDHHLGLGNALGSLADSTSKIKLPFLARRVKSEYDRAVELDPTSIPARHGVLEFYAQAPGVMGGSMDKARDQAREIGKLNPLRGHFEMAYLYSREKKTADVEREYIAAQKESPDSTVAWYTLGSFYQGVQRWDDAFGQYDTMLQRFPSETDVHWQIGRTAALSGQQLDRGEKALKFYLANIPKHAVKRTIAAAHGRLAMIYEKQGKKDLARSEYQQALVIDPALEFAKTGLAALK